jgi:UDP-N-acetylglucosamine transferase subunit ALG13
MDEIAGKIDEEVIMQIGYTKYKPKNSQYFDFAGYSKIKQLNNDARIVVSHAGVGSIITAFEQKTHLIIVPRLKKYDEVVDDHQLEIARELSKNPNVTILYDVENLDDFLKTDFSFAEECNRNILVHSLKKYISSISS